MSEPGAGPPGANSSEEGSRNPWEISKENIQPLSHGRKMSLLASSLTNLTVADDENILIEINELKSKLDHPDPTIDGDDDILCDWVKYFTYFEQRRLQDSATYSKMYLDYQKKCVVGFLKNLKVINDIRYVEIVLKHIESVEVDKRIRLLGALMNSGVGKTVAAIYIKQSEQLEGIQDYKAASDIIRQGIANNAEPIKTLEEHLKNLEYRVAENVIKNMQSQAENSTGGNSRNFGASVPLESGCEAPSIRTGLVGQASKLHQQFPVHQASKPHQPKINILNDDRENGPTVPEPVVPCQTIVRELEQIRTDSENKIEPGKWTNPENKFTVPVAESLEKIEVYESDEETVPFEKKLINKPVLQERKLDEPMTSDQQLLEHELEKSASSALTGQSSSASAGPQVSFPLVKPSGIGNTSCASSTNSTLPFTNTFHTSEYQHSIFKPSMPGAGGGGESCASSTNSTLPSKIFGGNENYLSFADYRKTAMPGAGGVGENSQNDTHTRSDTLTDTVKKTGEPEFKKPRTELLPELPLNCKLMCGIERVLNDGEDISFEEIRARKILKRYGPPPPIKKQSIPVPAPASMMISDEELDKKIQALLLPTLTSMTSKIEATINEITTENLQLKANYDELILERQNDTAKMNMILNHYQEEVQKLITQFQQEILTEMRDGDNRILSLEDKIRSTEEFMNELSSQLETLNSRVAVVMSNKSIEIKTEPAESKLPIFSSSKTFGGGNGKACERGGGDQTSGISFRNGSMFGFGNTTPVEEADVTNKKLLTAGPDMELDSQFFDNGNIISTGGALNTTASNNNNVVPPPEPTVAIFKQPLNDGEGDVDFNTSNLTRALFCNPQPLDCSTPEKKYDPKSSGTETGAVNFSVPSIDTFARRRSLFNQTLADVGQNLSTIPENSRDSICSNGNGSSGGQQTISGTRTSTLSSYLTAARSRYTMPGNNPFSHE